MLRICVNKQVYVLILERIFNQTGSAASAWSNYFVKVFFFSFFFVCFVFSLIKLYVKFHTISYIFILLIIEKPR